MGSSFNMTGTPRMNPSSLYELGDDSSMNVHNSERPMLYYYAHSPDDFQGPRMLPYQSCELPASCPETLASPDTNCQFRRGLLDNCAGARLYARILEFYVFWPNQVGSTCPLKACKEELPDQQSMLLHLKGCKHMADGEFWCPACHQWEKFRTRTSRRCSWDREHFGQKIFQKSRDIIRSLTTNSPGTQNDRILCYKCSSCLGTSTRDAHGSLSCSEAGSASVWQAETRSPSQAELELTPQAELGLTSKAKPGLTSRAELGTPLQFTAPRSLGELSGDSISMAPEPRPTSTKLDASTPVSELSADISPNGNRTDTVSSLSSPGYTEQSATIYFSGSERLPGNMGISEIDPTHHIQNRRYCSLYNNVLTSPRFNMPPTHSTSPATSDMPFVSSAFQPTKHLSLRIPDLGLEALAASVPSREVHSSLGEISHFGDFPPADDVFMEAHEISSPSFQSSSLVDSPMILDPRLDPQAQANTSMEIPLHQGPSSSSPFDELPAADTIFVVEQNLPSPSLQPYPPLAVPAKSRPTSTEKKDGDELYQCTHCDFIPKLDGVRGNRKQYLRKHFANKHGEPRRFPCEHCHFNFSRRDNLTTHLRRKHSIDNPSTLKMYRTTAGSSRQAPLKARALRAKSSQFI